jgi:hypothetical protein
MRKKIAKLKGSSLTTRKPEQEKIKFGEAQFVKTHIEYAYFS